MASETPSKHEQPTSPPVPPPLVLSSCLPIRIKDENLKKTTKHKDSRDRTTQIFERNAMPQFVFIELPSFRIKDKNGNAVNLNYRQLGHVIALLQYVRSGLRTGNYLDLSMSILFGGGETDLWTAGHTPHGHHAEENLLLAYFQSFDSPGAYPITDAMLLSSKPCSSCIEYFSLGGKQLRPQDGTTAAFRAKFTPRSDKSYTPVFYLARSLDAAQRSSLWHQLGQIWTGELGTMGVSLASSPNIQLGQVYFVLGNDSPWFALNGQENMTDAEIAEAIARQEVNPVYWIGR
ncbi:hypothetical protein F5Y19DRAFT_174844 [Xylariaceae sp. FL1651]|nr:hypothetical protein F5Y19DRAFT_174844 [Xylariaceae sp. FL1651]